MRKIWYIAPIIIIVVVLLIPSCVGTERLAAYKDFLVDRVTDFTCGREHIPPPPPPPPPNGTGTTPDGEGTTTDEGVSPQGPTPAPPTLEPKPSPDFNSPPLDEAKGIIKEYHLASDVSAYTKADLDSGDVDFLYVTAHPVIPSEPTPGIYDLTLISKIVGNTQYGGVSFNYRIGDSPRIKPFKIPQGGDYNSLAKGFSLQEVFEPIYYYYRSFNSNFVDLLSPGGELIIKINTRRMKLRLSPLIPSNELDNIAKSRTMMRTKQDSNLAIPLGANYQELFFYRANYSSVVEEQIIGQVYNDWCGNKGYRTLLENQNYNYLGISIESGERYFISVLIGK